ncbi:hypothetical protein D3C75_569190 [compost metagenome]
MCRAKREVIAAELKHKKIFAEKFYGKITRVAEILRRPSASHPLGKGKAAQLVINGSGNFCAGNPLNYRIINQIVSVWFIFLLQHRVRRSERDNPILTPYLLASAVVISCPLINIRADQAAAEG